jgi:20S proteasome alpha/beta subunit
MIAPKPTAYLKHHPNPSPIRRTAVERPRRRQVVTIAAAIKCSDGMVFCADTDNTIGDDAKCQRTKLFTFEQSLVVTGAGDVPLIKMTFDKICEDFSDGGVPITPNNARQAIEKVVLSVHTEHIFSFYQATELGRPSFSLIAGVRCSNGVLALIKTDNTSAHLCGAYEATGAGQPLFEYWARYFYRDNLDMDVMSYLALFMLREAKSSSTFCGGSSQVLKFPTDASDVKRATLYSESDLLVGFPDTVVRILSVLTDPKVSDDWIKAKLEEFQASVMAVRTHIRQTEHIEARLKAFMKGVRPPDSQS